MTDRSGQVGGWLVAAGALGVVIITGIYASAPTEASAPLPASVSVSAALDATLASIAKLRLAGTIGIVADVVLIGGCALLALRANESVPKRLLWLWLGLSTAIFIGVDGLAAFVIPPVAAATAGGSTAFIAVRGAFDLCFVLGVLTFGAAFIAVAQEATLARWLRIFSFAAGAISAAAFLLHAFGVTLPLLFGIAVGLAGLLGVIFGVREIRASA